MQMTRRGLLPLGLSALLLGRDSKYKLIAHRGGIVDAEHDENSRRSIEAAIARQYWMIEVDVRSTSDGEPIVHHDADFQRFFGDSRRVDALPWNEIRSLKSKTDGAAPLHFEEVCALCKGRIGLMLDIKSEKYAESVYGKIAAAMKRAELVRGALLLSGGDQMARLLEPACTRYYFDLASKIDEATVEKGRRENMLLVAAINTFRYTQAGLDEWEGPKEDAEKLKKWGVTHFQIDSRYESLFA